MDRSCSIRRSPSLGTGSLCDSRYEPEQTFDDVGVLAAYILQTPSPCFPGEKHGNGSNQGSGAGSGNPQRNILLRACYPAKRMFMSQIPEGPAL